MWLFSLPDIFYAIFKKKEWEYCKTAPQIYPCINKLIRFADVVE